MGCAGRVENAVNVVYCSYDVPAGHALAAARLYLPADWADDLPRRQVAGVPGDITFKTKPQPTIEMLAALAGQGIRTPWVAADEVYCRDTRLRPSWRKSARGTCWACCARSRSRCRRGRRIRTDAAANLVPPGHE